MWYRYLLITYEYEYVYVCLIYIKEVLDNAGRQANYRWDQNLHLYRSKRLGWDSDTGPIQALVF